MVKIWNRESNAANRKEEIKLQKNESYKKRGFKNKTQIWIFLKFFGEISNIWNM